MIEKNKETLLRHRAILLCIFIFEPSLKKSPQWVRQVGKNLIDASLEVWRKSLPPEHAEKIIEATISGYIRELSQYGETFLGRVAEVDLMLTKSNLWTEKEIQAMSTVTKTKSKTKSKAKTATKKITKVQVGDRIKISGTSWDGFIATVTKVDDQWVHVSTPDPTKKDPKRVFKGKVRPSRVLRKLPKAK